MFCTLFMFDLMLISVHQAEDYSCTNVKEKGAEVLIDGAPDEQNEAPDQPSETDRYGRGFPTKPNTKTAQRLEQLVMQWGKTTRSADFTKMTTGSDKTNIQTQNKYSELINSGELHNFKIPKMHDDELLNIF